MKKYDKLWHQCNTLLSHLRASKVVELIEEHYEQFGNNAPYKLTQQAMNKLQKSLDNAKQ